jgi:hypothetical protein
MQFDHIYIYIDKNNLLIFIRHSPNFNPQGIISQTVGRHTPGGRDLI